ncbi:chemotaxis protein CheW [Desulfitibacter alkalitolerans]|uniref:chemotaxis protein CheW n=1 Tax=Desulfitibacter alkalitolerans TaxID=264641 RepID=UPI00047F5A0E|nr:chemotaxis protein CheW [Desulfitibacter alkalitolerans]
MNANQNVRREEEQLVVFNLSGETYGVDISAVREIIRVQAITEVPRTPDFVEGVINLRGKVIPVIDLHKRFDLPFVEETSHTRIMVVEVDNVTVGMIVDAVSEVLRIPKDSIDPPPPVISGVDSAYLRGVGKLEDRLIILLDLNQVLHKKEKKHLEDVALAQDA